CSGSKQAQGQTDIDTPFTIPFSIVQLPLRIKKSELERNINQQLPDTLYADKNADGNGLEVLAQKQDDITIELKEKVLEYTVPLKIFAKKDLRLTDVQARGALTMNFQTEYDIHEDWSLTTTTLLNGYEWTEKPRLKVGFVNIPVELIADQVLDRSKDLITTAIDDQVKANLDLRSQIDMAWKMMHEPFLISEEYRTWMILNPNRIEMTPIEMEDESITSTIILESTPKVYLGEAPTVDAPAAPPPFQWSTSKETGFNIFIQTDIPFSEAEALARTNMVGERFESGKRYVVVEDLHLAGRGNRLVIETLLSGSYNGKVNLVGKPKYNALTQKLELSKLDVELKTSNFMHKTLGWLFKGAFKKQIRESVDYYLDFYLTQMKESIQNEFKNMPIAPGITMNGDLENFSVQQAYVGVEEIKVMLEMKGGIEVEVTGISE
ncbi:MAG: DUF4403 family protein, partial [Phaeodactylibacter sp.]|nr:DUF4403 family protein [Phaeodactylibacter sp.]